MTIILAVFAVTSGPSPVRAAPGETWSGTFSVNQEISYQTTDSFGNVTGSYSKSHLTSFSFSSPTGLDDDPYIQPVASWHTTYAERNNSGGRCPSYTAIDGEASGDDGRLEIRIEPEGQMVLEVLEYGSPGTFPATQSSQSCQDNQPSVSSTTASHQRIFLRTAGDPTAEELSGAVTQSVANGTIRYEWNLVRGQNPSEGDDNLVGTGRRDVIELGGGNDVFSGRGGNDKAYGGEGDDELNGDRGNDLLVGGDGTDTLQGGAGDDIVNGDGPNGFTHAETRAYRSYSHGSLAPGPDFLFGGGGSDHLTGGAGLDRLDGGPGKDTCIVDSRKEKRQAKSCEVIKLKRSR